MFRYRNKTNEKIARDCFTNSKDELVELEGRSQNIGIDLVGC